MTTEPIKSFAHELISRGVTQLSEQEQIIINSIADRLHGRAAELAERPHESTFGERLADKVAAVGGSWAFVSAFGIFLVIWAILNVELLPEKYHFDPYPFIFLNLLLSMLAAIQAPIIMMSQNRQAYKDRIQVQQDLDIDLKAELEILSLHEKVDRLLAMHEL